MTCFSPLGGKTRLGPRGRRGTSLIETMAIVSVGAILTGVVVTGMAALFRYDKHLRAHTSERDQLQMLVQQLRGDIRQATRCQHDSAEQMLTLERDDEEAVLYHWFDDHVERTSESGGVSAIRRYLIPSTLELAVAPVDAGRGQLVQLHFTTDDKDGEIVGAGVSPEWNLEIQAEVGRDLWSQQHHSQGQERR